MSPLIDRFDERYRLGIPRMDDTHREFVELVNRLAAAPNNDFIPLFAELQSHTSEHFEQENAWMERSNFPALREHLDEHRRVLGELDRFGQRAAAGRVSMARAYVTEQLPHWFDLHAKTMDSALAHHMKLQPVSVLTPASADEVELK